MNIKKQVIWFCVGLTVLIVAGVVCWYIKPYDSPSVLTPTATTSTATTTVVTTPPASTATTSGFKTYRNEEWGFEFEYPEGWKVAENVYDNYYIQFNLILLPETGIHHEEPVIVNIDLPEYPEKAFKNLDKTTENVAVDGVKGVKYVYDWNDDTITAIILPLGKYSMILGSNDHYTELFDQVITSFRFLHQ